MVTFSETTHISPMELREPTCVTATLSPGLRRKKRLWQNAVKHIMIQQELSAQVIFISQSSDRAGVVLYIFLYRFMRANLS